MEIRNTPAPTQTFTGIRINESAMNEIQAGLSRRLSDMLDYTDEYVKSKDSVDVYMLPGKNEKSVIIKFMDKFSDMFYRKNNRIAQTSIHSERSNYSKSINDIRSNLQEIETGNYKAPEMDVEKVLAGETDFAKVDPASHEMFVEGLDDIKAYESLYGNAYAQDEVVELYNRTKLNSLDNPNFNFSEF